MKKIQVKGRRLFKEIALKSNKLLSTNFDPFKLHKVTVFLNEKCK